MAFGIPGDEIKTTLANADKTLAEVNATLAQVRADTLPRVDKLVVTAEATVKISVHTLARIEAAAVQAEALVGRLSTLVEKIEHEGLTIVLKAGSPA